MTLTPIHDFLNGYSEYGKNTIRCHMPGHKGSANKSDITEIYGAGSLYDECGGIISESEDIASGLFGSKATFYSAGGNTLAIQSMLSLLKKTGVKNKVIAGRYSHKSLISAAILLGLEVEYVYPDEYLSAEISPRALEEAVKANGNEVNATGIFLTSVDYYGGMCDVRKAADIAEKYRLPLLVDNAHGAYLAFGDNHPLKQGACMSADSAHKTLPALTGAAYLHIGKSGYADIFKENAKREMALFGSSSPSYLILESLDLCNRHLAERKDQAESAFFYVDELKRKLREHGYILRESDCLRIVINAKSRGYSGFELANKLRGSFVECEMSDENHVVLLFSTITVKQDTDGVLKALAAIGQKKPLPYTVFPVIKPHAAMPPGDAYFSASEKVSLNLAKTRICSEINAPCPPCVPLVMPGEVYDAEAIEALGMYGISHVRVVKERI